MLNYTVICFLQELHVTKNGEHISIYADVVLPNLLRGMQLNFKMGVEGVAH
jgi:hypothetical protein